MQTLSDSLVYRRLCASLLMLSLLVAPAFGQQPAQSGQPSTAAAAAARPAAPLTKAERDAASRLKLETIREAITTLSSKEMEGRGTAQPGGDRAARYIADRFARLGLKPLGDAGSYLQAIKFRVSQVQPETVIRAGQSATLKHGEDFALPPPYTYEQADAAGGLVVVGFGVVSPELKRDDLAALDLKDKIVVVFNGRPKGVDAPAWAKATNPQTRTMNIFGRGARAILVANLGNEQQPFSMLMNYLSRRRVSLASAPEPPFKLPPVALVSDAGLEKLFAGTGMTYAETLRKALDGEQVSRDLGKQAELSFRIRREEGTSSNVVGLLEGSDPKLKEEAVVYSAHYDAYGIDAQGRIYPGAADNALGTGMVLGIAEAFARTTPRPRRSVIFLAVTGEEYGLLGSDYWVKHPTWPIEKVAANINHDSAGTEIYAPVKRVVGWGQEHSDLGTIFEQAVVATGNIVTPDPLPEERVFYRSDHYSFARKGVPSIMLLGGPGGEINQWLPRLKKWLVTDYHSPNDTVRPDWDWTGPHTLATVGLIMGLRVAAAEQMPAWLTTSPFNRPRGTNEPPPSPR